VDRLGKHYLSVHCAADLKMSAMKRPKKPKSTKLVKTRLRVDKSKFDGVLENLIKSKPVKRT
jgi:hypothetical protein